jgi:hypothetical protein
MLRHEEDASMRSMFAGLCVATLSLMGSTACADEIPWAATGMGSVIFNNNNASQNSSVTLTGLTIKSSSTLGLAYPTGPSPTLFDVTTSSTALPSAPDSFMSVPFTVGVSLTDTISVGKTGAVSTAKLQFAGTVTDQSVSPSAVFPGGVFWTANPQQVTLGSPGDWRLYTVQIFPFDLVNTNVAPTVNPLFVAVAPFDVPMAPSAPPPTEPPPDGPPTSCVTPCRARAHQRRALRLGFTRVRDRSAPVL